MLGLYGFFHKCTDCIDFFSENVQILYGFFSKFPIINVVVRNVEDDFSANLPCIRFKAEGNSPSGL